MSQDLTAYCQAALTLKSGTPLCSRHYADLLPLHWLITGSRLEVHSFVINKLRLPCQCPLLPDNFRHVGDPFTALSPKYLFLALSGYEQSKQITFLPASKPFNSLLVMKSQSFSMITENEAKLPCTDKTQDSLSLCFPISWTNKSFQASANTIIHILLQGVFSVT